MKFMSFTIQLRDEKAMQEYKKYHLNVWPEIIGSGGALEVIGVLKMRIFFIKPLTLFMYIEATDAFDPVKDFSRAVSLDPRVQEWDDIMHNQLLVRIKENDGPLNWALMENVFSYERAEL